METNEVFPARETNPADFAKLEGPMGTFEISRSLNLQN